MHHAGINQARFFATGDDFNRKAQRGFGFRHEFFDVFGDAESVGGDHAHLFGLEILQALAKSGQAVERALLRFFAEVFLLVETGGQTHHLFEGINDFQLAVVVFANLQTETVGTQIDGSEHVGGSGGHGEAEDEYRNGHVTA